MNLIDAIKSGRPWYPVREPRDVYLRLAVKGDPILDRSPSSDLVLHDVIYKIATDGGRPIMARPLTLTDLFDDYQIEESAVTITRNQFWAAVQGSSSSSLGQELRLDYAGIERLARKLGLEA